MIRPEEHTPLICPECGAALGSPSPKGHYTLYPTTCAACGADVGAAALEHVVNLTLRPKRRRRTIQEASP